MLPFRDHNPTRTFPLVTVTLIVLNALVFLYMVALEQQSQQALLTFVYRAAVIPAAFVGHYDPKSGIDPLNPVWLTVFTAMFMHAGWLHLAGNMLYLWIFGNNIEDIMGPVRFTIFYLVCGIAATAAHIASVLYQNAHTPGGSPAMVIPSLGASGAIAGVLGAYLVRFPRAQIDTCVFFIFITIIRLPALVVLAFWFVLQFFQGVTALVGTAGGGGIAFWAHIGGFLAGMLLVNLFAKRQNVGYTEERWYYPNR